MATVGIRDLKQNASAIVARAAAGEVIEITNHGRPVARLGPASESSPYLRMLREGRIVPARANLLEHRPRTPLPGGLTGTEALSELRSNER